MTRPTRQPARSGAVRAAIALVLAGLLAPRLAASTQWPVETVANLRVLPDTITPAALVALMGTFTRALGVGCSYCHVGVAGQPLSSYDFSADDRPTKAVARSMLRMVRAINQEHLGGLATRNEPAVQVECATCHRGTTVPRMLQDVLTHAYRAGGIDSAVAAYRQLRRRYHGRSTYDFGEVPLADVGGLLWTEAAHADAERLYALNVEFNPESDFAKRSHATAALTLAFRTGGAHGEARYEEIETAYGADALPEGVLNVVGYRLLAEERFAAAVAAFRLNVSRFPTSSNVYDSLGEAYARQGDRAMAVRSYGRALELDPENANAREQLRRLRAQNR
ncbi:MAG TPA: c-type cytochrome [Gemmatimonadales bacterium]